VPRERLRWKASHVVHAGSMKEDQCCYNNLTYRYINHRTSTLDQLLIELEICLKST
jgi:hypothetical protein